MLINKQENYIRNVQIASFIIYKTNWNIIDINKFNKSKNKIKFLKNLYKNGTNRKYRTRQSKTN